MEELLEKVLLYFRDDPDGFFNNFDENIAVISSDNKDIDGLIEYSDQDIKDYLTASYSDKEREKYLMFLTRVKNTLSVAKIENETKGDNTEGDDLLSSIKEYFNESNIPFDELELSLEKDRLVMNINFSDGSRFKDKIQELNSWSTENVIETFSNKYRVPVVNISYIDSVSKYIEFISGFENINYVSRGQKNCQYDLIPSLHRLYKSSYKSHSSIYESLFKQKVAFYDSSLENKDAEELRAYGQHFGLPTNYLDFTEAHLISLLFAVEDYRYTENHSIVYFVDALAHNKEAIKDEIKLVDFSDRELKATKEKNYSDKSYFIKVGNSSERIHFQKGCFLKVEPNDSLSSMLQNYTKVAIIDRNSKKTILTELFNLGITFENIYPDKDNMVKTIKFINEEI
ncbi:MULTISPECIES: FRG domain-containing protein [Paenibacillus]|uniref:FRG domain-containing protein n=1 Tax=Paenibacillus TaxID=44249 RepID=UPI00017891C2|nr:FRG domain-containing protein [Paenibacillus sp. Y412MC10]ACX68485.1 FRG domain protein [Paenibacillus sp. Y412MC10]